MILTEKQEKILLYMLGLDCADDPFRNHYPSSVNSSDYGELEILREKQLITHDFNDDEKFPPAEIILYRATESGIKLAKHIKRVHNARS